MKKVSETTWGVSAAKKAAIASHPEYKTSFENFFRSIAQTIRNVNELIDRDAEIRRILNNRPF